ncbi:uncharacterized protein BO97DRAFT_129370 [Aspergillus homomorphus CBS 101889]|uniref:TRAF-type domain-containing protein n=1 Tax=Aspergillus homomorphus (strain CBS 101889) TaxID=1450537 RepID=A0A395I862_ASPHC|nr:hypothetical protein BO97DRAFT_129370 [Aspergillus homomorphus CBS 101889]RAL16271.1 hypothetical protein BO97DRAFT_129370 [Aspergillus homomorphus CBS 101889]
MVNKNPGIISGVSLQVELRVKRLPGTCLLSSRSETYIRLNLPTPTLLWVILSPRNTSYHQNACSVPILSLIWRSLNPKQPLSRTDPVAMPKKQKPVQPKRKLPRVSPTGEVQCKEEARHRFQILSSTGAKVCCLICGGNMKNNVSQLNRHMKDNCSRNKHETRWVDRWTQAQLAELRSLYLIEDEVPQCPDCGHLLADWARTGLLGHIRQCPALLARCRQPRAAGEVDRPFVREYVEKHFSHSVAERPRIERTRGYFRIEGGVEEDDEDEEVPGGEIAAQRTMCRLCGEKLQLPWDLMIRSQRKIVLERHLIMCPGPGLEDTWYKLGASRSCDNIGCKETILHSELPAHRRQCPWRDLECPDATPGKLTCYGCGTEVGMASFEPHMKDCKKICRRCTYCGRRGFTPSEFKEHKKSCLMWRCYRCLDYCTWTYRNLHLKRCAFVRCRLCHQPRIPAGRQGDHAQKCRARRGQGHLLTNSDHKEQVSGEEQRGLELSDLSDLSSLSEVDTSGEGDEVDHLNKLKDDHLLLQIMISVSHEDRRQCSILL